MGGDQPFCHGDPGVINKLVYELGGTPSDHLILKSGWWLGHPSEKYESQLG